MNSRCKPFLLPLGPWLLLCALTGAAFALAGCAIQPVTAITLSGVVRGEQTVLTGPVSRDAAQLVRNGASYPVSPGMVMQPGDALSTGPETSVVISYPGGARAYIRPNTRVRIGSIIDDIGKVFVKVKGVFRVQTEFVIAGSEGTQYWVDVKERQQLNVVVVEGVVSLASNAASWPARALRAGEQAVLSGASAPTLYAASPADIRRETDWVNSMDRRVPVQTSVSPWAIGTALGLGAAILINSDGAPKPGPAPTQPSPRTESAPPTTQPSPGTVYTPAGRAVIPVAPTSPLR
jgi:hypothetical protein